MSEIFLRIFDYFAARRILRRALFGVLTGVLAVLVAQLSYREDISDFVPFGGRHATALTMLQDVSGASKIFVTFSTPAASEPTPDALVSAADTFAAALTADKALPAEVSVVSAVDVAALGTVTRYALANIPYFLTPADYARIDSLLATPGYVGAHLSEARRNLTAPGSPMLQLTFTRDPLGLFTPALERLAVAARGTAFTLYDAHILTPDMRTAVVTIDTPFGANESERNAALLALVQAKVDAARQAAPSVEVGVTGSPVIAVGNARQIKTDSILALSIAGTLILALLLYVFRSRRNILLIAATAAWGWVFAMALLSLVHSRVSVIVVGISSIVIGIAVNYPLHVIAHVGHGRGRRAAFREIVAPLLVGNVTTVGAFVALVPLQSAALRDLGLFASFLLVGTIICSLVFLPHEVKSAAQTRSTFIDRLSRADFRPRRAHFFAILAVTAVLGYFSLSTAFDANLSHINYMSAPDRAAMARLETMLRPDTATTQLYALASGPTLDTAVSEAERADSLLRQMQAGGQATDVRSCTALIVSSAEQQRRLALWERFVRKFASETAGEFAKEARAVGFSEGTFARFDSLLSASYAPKPTDAFLPMLSSVYRGYLSRKDAETHIVVPFAAPTASADAARERIDRARLFGFSMQSINATIATGLSDNFAYIGWACGLIVFLFLWGSMGRIELALISFAPMAVSWVWILGLMSLAGVQFNIVNIILATFIFGQGDDYTIFMTEGAAFEYAHRRRILASYRHSIIVSALIMFVGIGALIVARHPAMHSLAEVTIIGMSAVVLMAYVLPPMLFRWLVSCGETYRRRPVTLGRVLRTSLFRVEVCLVRLALWIEVGLSGRRPTHSARRQRHAAILMRGVLRSLPGVKIAVGETPAADVALQLLREHPALLGTALAHRLGIGEGEAGESTRRLALFGAEDVFADGGSLVCAGTVWAEIARDAEDARRRAETLRRSHGTATHYIPLVADRFLYKGTDIARAVRRELRDSAALAATPADGQLRLKSDGYGACALALALVHPETHVLVEMAEAERADVLRFSAETLAPNLEIILTGNDEN